MDPIETTVESQETGEAARVSFANRALANGRRLSEDAIFLLKNGRFATATSIAIISLEELGKYKLCKWEQEGNPVSFGKRWNLHTKRQCIASAIVLAVCMLEEFQKTISKRNLTFNDLVVDSEDRISIEGTPSEQIPAEWLAEAISGLDTRIEARLFMVSSVGFMQDVKHAGLYADESPKNKYLTDSSSIDEKTARMYVSLAKAVSAVIDNKALDAAVRSVIGSGASPLLAPHLT